MNKVCIWLLGVAAAICLWELSAIGADAAKLLPTQLLIISVENGAVRVRSDNGAAGSGQTLSRALVQMQRSAEGRLFLDTAEHIVVEQSARELLPQIIAQERFRPAAKLYQTQRTVADVTKLLSFLQAHPGEVRLVQARAFELRGQTVKLPCIDVDETGGMQLAG